MALDSRRGGAPPSCEASRPAPTSTRSDAPSCPPAAVSARTLNIHERGPARRSRPLRNTLGRARRAPPPWPMRRTDHFPGVRGGAVPGRHRGWKRAGAAPPSRGALTLPSTLQAVSRSARGAGGGRRRDQEDSPPLVTSEEHPTRQPGPEVDASGPRAPCGPARAAP